MNEKDLVRSTKTRYSDNFYYYVNDDVIGLSLEKYGEYSQSEIDFLTSILTPNSIVYDIGSNIGYHTTAFASRAGLVMGFEPHPKTFEILARNTENLNNVTILNAAVSDVEGTAHVVDYDPSVPGNYGGVSLNETGPVEVACVNFSKVKDLLPDLIKIDVEGSEYAVIRSCLDLIKQKIPVIYYEAHETEHLKEIYMLLAPFGYKFYWAAVKNFNENNFNQNKENVFGDTALHSVVAWPNYLAPLDLPEVAGPEDTLESFYERLGFSYTRAY